MITTENDNVMSRHFVFALGLSCGVARSMMFVGEKCIVIPSLSAF